MDKDQYVFLKQTMPWEKDPLTEDEYYRTIVEYELNFEEDKKIESYLEDNKPLNATYSIENSDGMPSDYGYEEPLKQIITKKQGDNYEEDGGYIVLLTALFSILNILILMLEYVVMDSVTSWSLDGLYRQFLYELRGIKDPKKTLKDRTNELKELTKQFKELLKEIENDPNLCLLDLKDDELTEGLKVLEKR